MVTVSMMKSYLIRILLLASIHALGQAAPVSFGVQRYQRALETLSEQESGQFAREQLSDSWQENNMAIAKIMKSLKLWQGKTASAAPQFSDDCPLKDKNPETFSFKDAALLIVDALRKSDISFECRRDAQLGSIFRIVANLLEKCGSDKQSVDRLLFFANLMDRFTTLAFDNNPDLCKNFTPFSLEH